MTEDQIRRSLCSLARSLFERGLTPGSSGNISVRLEDGGWPVTPTKEIPLHASVYDSCPGTRAVVHLHSSYCVAVSMLPGLDPANALPPLTPYQLMRCGATALLPYFRPGDPAVGEAIARLEGRHTSFLLANHGPVVAGPSLEAAVFAAEELEETAKLHILLLGARPRHLDQDQIDDLVAHFKLPAYRLPGSA